MSQLTTPTLRDDQRATSDQSDPWRYGYRWKKRRLPDGQLEWEQVPLTLKDVMYPKEGDFVTTSDAHERFCAYLRTVLTAYLAQVVGAVVLSDMLIRWDVPGVRPMGPDVAVVFGVRERREWHSFDLAAEGAQVALIIEITSLETRRLDLKRKVARYAQAGVPF
ncbi:MAG: Uma2 family endonuclease, partial [Ardenticatenaceae bacterium]